MSVTNMNVDAVCNKSEIVRLFKLQEQKPEYFHNTEALGTVC